MCACEVILFKKRNCLYQWWLLAEFISKMFDIFVRKPKLLLRWKLDLVDVVFPRFLLKLETSHKQNLADKLITLLGIFKTKYGRQLRGLTLMGLQHLDWFRWVSFGNPLADFDGLCTQWKYLWNIWLCHDDASTNMAFQCHTSMKIFLKMILSVDFKSLI